MDSLRCNKPAVPDPGNFGLFTRCAGQSTGRQRQRALLHAPAHRAREGSLQLDQSNGEADLEAIFRG